MIRSMTGFGSATSTSEFGDVAVEVKSLNNRFLDLNVKFPRELAGAEMQLREEVKRRIKRGKVDVYIRWTAAPGASALYDINKPLLQHYITELEQISQSTGASQIDLGALLGLPGVITPSAAVTEDGVLLRTALTTLVQALEALEQSRQVEGAEMVAALQNHLAVLQKLRAQIAEGKDELLADYRTRLKERIETLAKAVDIKPDPARLETEILLYADKSDITEELVRLDAHLKSFAATLGRTSEGEPVGKSLDFLVQELLREANTIGNKARGVAVAQFVVQMKSEIEKIREQVQNLE